MASYIHVPALVQVKFSVPTESTMNEGVPVGGTSVGGVVGRSILACETSQLALRPLGRATTEAVRANERIAPANISVLLRRGKGICSEN